MSEAVVVGCGGKSNCKFLFCEYIYLGTFQIPIKSDAIYAISFYDQVSKAQLGKNYIAAAYVKYGAFERLSNYENRVDFTYTNETLTLSASNSTQGFLTVVEIK
ncbi:MAG: hypothetical protein RR085_02485 [Clostridia bacterium]